MFLKLCPLNHGLPTIFDKDVLIFCISQLMHRNLRPREGAMAGIWGCELRGRRIVAGDQACQDGGFGERAGNMPLGRVLRLLRDSGAARGLLGEWRALLGHHLPAH
jgi:hypothetical protein